MRNLLLLILFFAAIHTQAQEGPEQSIKLGAGLGLHLNPYPSTALTAQLGYQRAIINDHWRLNPNFNYSHYSPAFPIGALPLTISSYTLELNLFYDLNFTNKSRFFLGLGAFTSLLEGHVTTSDPDKPGYQELNESVSKIYAGTVLSGGVRIGNPGGSTLFTIIPFNLYLGTHSYLEFYLMKLQLDIRL